MYFSVEKVIAGKWLKRKEWGKNAILLLEKTRPEEVNLLTGGKKETKTIKQIVMINLISGDTSPWMGAAPDLLANDWEEYAHPKEEEKEE